MRAFKNVESQIIDSVTRRCAYTAEWSISDVKDHTELWLHGVNDTAGKAASKVLKNNFSDPGVLTNNDTAKSRLSHVNGYQQIHRCLQKYFRVLSSGPKKPSAECWWRPL